MLYSDLKVNAKIECLYNGKHRAGKVLERGGNKLYNKFGVSHFGPEWVKVETQEGPKTFTVEKMQGLAILV